MTIEDLLGYSTDDLVALANKGDAALEELLGEHFTYTRPALTPSLPTTDSIKEAKPTKAKAKVKEANKDATAKANIAVELAMLLKAAGVSVPKV